mmetsp:Transcript_102261/g.266918  ORF Transcript_102261/g.266918 Transcript_102261/m.266918 type:complete len:359 (+) Transcript_102261:872-1948(+)
MICFCLLLFVLVVLVVVNVSLVEVNVLLIWLRGCSKLLEAETRGMTALLMLADVVVAVVVLGLVLAVVLGVGFTLADAVAFDVWLASETLVDLAAAISLARVVSPGVDSASSATAALDIPLALGFLVSVDDVLVLARTSETIVGFTLKMDGNLATVSLEVRWVSCSIGASRTRSGTAGSRQGASRPSASAETPSVMPMSPDTALVMASSKSDSSLLAPTAGSRGLACRAGAAPPASAGSVVLTAAGGGLGGAFASERLVPPGLVKPSVVLGAAMGMMELLLRTTCSPGIFGEATTSDALAEKPSYSSGCRVSMCRLAQSSNLLHGQKRRDVSEGVAEHRLASEADSSGHAFQPQWPWS